MEHELGRVQCIQAMECKRRTAVGDGHLRRGGGHTTLLCVEH